MNVSQTNDPSPISSDFLGFFQRDDGIWIRFKQPARPEVEARIKEEDIADFQKQMGDTEGKLDVRMLWGWIEDSI